MTDPLADMLTRIRNALLRNKTSVLTPASKLRENVLLVLQDEGYIRGYLNVYPINLKNNSLRLDATSYKFFKI